MLKLLLCSCLLLGFASADLESLNGTLSSLLELPATRSGQPSCACGWSNRRRIVGGVEADQNGYPWMVAIHDARTGGQFCGGSIITPFHVLTAAHCINDHTAAQLLINVGAHNLQARSHGVHRVRQVIGHERYNPRTIENDIALLVTADRIEFNQNVGPVCLPTRRVNLAGQRVRALGWGLTSHGGRSSNVLRRVDLTVIPFRDCLNSWRFAPSVPREDTNFCTFENRRDTCQGDSGGPLVFVDPSNRRFTIAGVVSFGGDCASHMPAVNADVSAFLGWINSNIAASRLGVTSCS